MPDTDDPLALGATVHDEHTGRYDTVADTATSPGLVFLRPLGGGREWTARREHLRPATTGELLETRLRTARATTTGDDSSTAWIGHRDAAPSRPGPRR